MKGIFLDRISLLRKELSLDVSEAFFTLSTEDVLYLTDFNSSNSNLIVSKFSSKIFTDKRYSQQVKKLKSQVEFEFIQDGLIEAIKKFCNENKIQTIFFEPSKISVQKVTELKKIGSLKLKPLRKDISFIFALQDEYSIKQTKDAIKIAENIFQTILGNIKEGISEIDIYAELKYLIHKSADGEAFDPIVLFGKNTSYPHGRSSNYKLKKNSPILIDFGVKVKGYNSDFTRTIFFGKPINDFIRIYEIVREALHIAIHKIEENILVREVALSVIDYFKKHRLEKHFTHALGHGLGVYLHNFPRISEKSNQKIFDNLILAIEPALYFENKFGIRTEQNVLLYKGRKEILTKTTDKLIVL